MKITKLFGENIRKIRTQKGYSQEKLAELAGLHRTYIGAVERAERNITLVNAQKIAEALDVALADCLNEMNDE